MFVINYTKGCWDNFEEVLLFVTDDETYAKKYVEKFNNILEKYKTFLIDNFLDVGGDFNEDCHYNFIKFNNILNYNMCEYKHLNFRNETNSSK